MVLYSAKIAKIWESQRSREEKGISVAVTQTSPWVPHLFEVWRVSSAMRRKKTHATVSLWKPAQHSIKTLKQLNPARTDLVYTSIASFISNKMHSVRSIKS